MMMPTIPSTSYSGGAVSSSSVLVLVDKATSEFLLAPDWTINIDICDTVNSNHWLAKDVVKAVKKRLQHKKPIVQLLALTLIETMVKNCGDFVHFQIADRNIVQEMVKIVKKKADMHVRDKILLLLDSWQEAFGGPGGKYPQYYWAYEELRRSGVSFPERSLDTVPIFTPPPTHTTPRAPSQSGYGMPSSSSARLDEAMAAEDQILSLSLVQSMRNVLDLLADMLQALNPNDSSAVKDEIIVDLVEQCRSNQKKLMQMLTTIGDEELLGQGLDLNDSLQNVLAKHDAIASGVPPSDDTYSVGQTSHLNDSNGKPTDITTGTTTTTTTTTTNTTTSALNSGPSLPVAGNTHESEEEEEDDFLQLVRRHSKTHPSASLDTHSENSNAGPLVISDSKTVTEGESSSVITSNAIVPVDLPAPATSNQDQDIIDLLSITLSETPVSLSHNPYHQEPSQNTETNPYASHMNQPPQSYSYVAPWANPTRQPETESQPQIQQPPCNPIQAAQPQHSYLYHGQNRTPQPNPQHSGYSTGYYPPPPWAATPGYYGNQNPIYRSGYTYSTTQDTTSLTPAPVNPETRTNPVPRSIARVDGQKPFIPSYRLFEELNVLGNDGNLNTSGNTSSSSFSGSNSQSMVRGAK